MFVQEDPSALSHEQLEEELAAQAALVDAGLCRLVELAAECERRLPCAGDGTTFAAWLAWRCSLLPRQAREHERIGKRLAELPLTRSAFARGEVSYAKVSVLTRIAESETEERLLELAEVMTASQPQRAVGAYRQLSREEAAEQHEREFLDYFWTDDGSLSMRARLAAEDGFRRTRATVERGGAGGDSPIWRSPGRTVSARAATGIRSSFTSMRRRWRRWSTDAASSPTAGRWRRRRRGDCRATARSSSSTSATVSRSRSAASGGRSHRRCGARSRRVTAAAASRAAKTGFRPVRRRR